MQPIPVEFFSEQGGTFYIPTLPSTASLLAYYDAGITSSYTSGSSTWYDLTGNGYHATLTGSMPTYSTDIAGNHYNYNPSLTFNIGQGYFSAPDSLCTNFGTTQYQITLPFPSIETMRQAGGTLHQLTGNSLYHIAGITDISVNASVHKLYYSGSTTDLAWKNTTPVGGTTVTSHFDISGVYQIV